MLWQLALSRCDCMTLAAIPRRSSWPECGGGILHLSSVRWKQPCRHPALPAWGSLSRVPMCDTAVMSRTGLPAPSCLGLLTCFLWDWRHFLALLVYFILSMHSLARGGLDFLISLWEKEWRKTSRHCVYGHLEPLFLGRRTPDIVHCYRDSPTA